MKQYFVQLEAPFKRRFVIVSLALPGIVLFLLGSSMYLISLEQPAWFEGNIGPGLMAQWLSKAVAIIGLVWSVISIYLSNRQTPSGCGSSLIEQRWSGVFLITAVFQFCLLLPILGLVLSSGIAAALASIGAGERHWVAVFMTSLVMTVMAAVIGATLLPPATQLWPLR